MLYYPIFWELSQSISIAVLSISWLNKNDLQTCHQELRKELQRGTLLLGFTVSFCLQSSGSVDDVDASFLPTFHNCQARLAVASATRSQRLSCKHMQALHAWRMSAMFFRITAVQRILWNRFLVPFLHVFATGESPSKFTTISRHRACHWRWVDNSALSPACCIFGHCQDIHITST